MAQQNYNVSLSFSANTAQARKDILSLINSLNELSKDTLKISLTRDISKDVKEASLEVNKFAGILKSAVNVDTGKLDLSKLNSGLKQSNTDLTKMAQSFKALGNDGVRAFSNVVKQINAAEVPLKKTNTAVDKLWTSLKNTVNWQISSSVLHGLMSGVLSAFRYAEDLNESLNNIRIVTGYNTEEMARFAELANKAAKALSTTTTEYADASLIYYQQGLSDSEVAKRTEVTIKMANAAGLSAQVVSDQLTAIWNNFYDGSKSLEYYADVMTALGAATASSTDEIAGGLEKFAAIGDTIGLSYEYAASALATITSNTRQSEEVVGTALKTIFARIQGLNLGETLDDGTTLNKYSEALQKIGISIFDSSGEMKKMDNILDEMASKWDSLSNAQQTALAQTVAGTRQYTQLVALMDNWNTNDNDSMTANLNTAYGASGALQKQADIYADSWDAAQKRVQASAEAIYQSLIDDEFMIDLLDGFSKILDMTNNLIGSLGGMKGLLFTISSYILTIARTKISDDLKVLMGPSVAKKSQEAMDTKELANKQLLDMSKAVGAGREALVLGNTYSLSAAILKEMIKNADKMTDQQREIVSNLIAQFETLGDIVAAKARSVDASDKEIKSLTRQLRLEESILRNRQEADTKRRIEDIEGVLGSGNLLNRRGAQFSPEDIARLNLARLSAGLDDLSEDLISTLTIDNTSLSGAARTSHMEKYLSILAAVNQELEEAKQRILGITFVPVTRSLEDYKTKSILAAEATALIFTKETSALSFIEKFRLLPRELQEVAFEAAGGSKTFGLLVASLNSAETQSGEVTAEMERLLMAMDAVRVAAREQVTNETIGGLDPDRIELTTQNIDDLADEIVELTRQERALAKEGQEVSKTMQELPPKLPDWQEQLVAAAGGVTSLIGAFNSLSGIWDTLNDLDLTFWEKFNSICMTLGAVIPSLVMSWKALKDAKIKDTIVTALNTAASWANVDAKNAEADANNRTSKSFFNFGDSLKKIGDTAKKAGSKIKGGFNKVLKAGQGVLTKYGATIGSVAAGVAVAAVIIGGCVLAFNALSDAYHKNEIEALKLEEVASNLSSAYTEAKSEYDNLLNTMSNYSSAKDGLSDLTRGTAEFAQLITTANEEAIKLLNTYGNLIGTRYSVDSDGLISIDQEALEDIKQLELDKTLKAQSASVIANQKAREARTTANATELHRNTIKTSEGMTSEDWNETGQAAAVTTGVGAGIGLAAGAGTAIAGAATGAAVGSAVPIVGTLIGAAVGLIVGGVTAAVINAVDKNSETDSEKAALESLAENYGKFGEVALTDDKIKEAYGDDTLTQEQIAAIKELCYEMRANTIATEAENQAMANLILADNEIVLNARDKDDIGIFAGDAYAQATEDAYQKYMDMDMANFWGVGTEEGKAAWSRYAESQGLNDLKDYKVTNYKKDGSVEYSYTDEDGKTLKKTVTAEELASVLAAEDADDAVNKAGELIVDILNNLQEGTVDILSGAKSGDMSALTMGLLTENNQELLNMSEADLLALGFEGTKSEILAEIAAQQTANIENVKKAGLLYGDAVSGLITTMVDNNDSTIKNVTQGTLKAYADTLNDLATHGGEDVMKNFDTGLLGIMDKYSNKSEEIMSIANNIDWSQGESALQDFNYQLMLIGINIDEGSAEWTALVNAMQNINTSVVHRDLDSIRSQIVDIKELTQDIEIGSIISDEEYNKLIKYKAELADMFMMTADGYQYIGGGDINEMSDDYAKELLLLTKDDNAKARAAYNAINAWGWTDGTNFTKEDWYGMANGTDSNTKMNSMTNALLLNESDHIEDMGYDADYLLELSNTLVDPEATQEQINAAKAVLQQFYSDILTLNENYENDVYDDTKAEEVYASTAEDVGELSQMYADGSISVDTYTKAQQALANLLIQSALSLTELQNAVGASGGSYDQLLVDEKLIELGEKYKHCADEVKNFELALLSNDLALIDEARSMLEVSIELSEMAELYGLDAEATANYADRLADGNAQTASAKRAFGLMAIAAQRLDRGVKNINENLDDYKKVLKSANDDTFEWSETMDALKTDIADMFNVADGNMFSDTFARGLLDSEDFLKALLGDIEALDRLRAGAAVDIGDNIIADLGDQANTLQTEYRNAAGEIVNASFTAQSAWDYVRGVLQDGFTLEEINDEKFVESLNQMIQASGMTKDQILSMLGSMGVSAEVVTNYVLQETEVPTYYDYSVNEGWDDFSYTDDDGVHTVRKPRIRKMTVPGKPVKVMGWVPTYSLKTTSGDVTSGGDVDYSNTFTKASAPSISSSSVNTGSGGGGSSSPSTMDKRDTTDKSDVVERYREVNDAIDNVTDALTRAEKATDRLWGRDKLNAMREENKILQQQYDLLQEKAKQAKEYAEEDYANLMNVASEAGISLVVDRETGDIVNIEDEMEKLYNDLAEAEAIYNLKVEDYNTAVAKAEADGTVSDEENDKLESMKDAIEAYEEDILGAIEDDIEAVQNAEQQFQDSVETWEDMGLEMEDVLDQIMQNNYDIIMEGLLIPLSLNEEDLRYVDLQLSKLEDDVYQMAEALVLTMGKVDEYSDNLRLADEALAQLNEQHQLYIDTNGQAGITDAAYQEGLNEIKDQYYDNIEALMELDKMMETYYSDTLDAANEELSKYTDLMEHQTSVLEHYQSLIELMGKSNDYKMIGEVLEGQVETSRDAMEVSKNWYEARRADADTLAAEYAAAEASGASEAELEIIRNNWLAAEAAANEAQDQMLSDAEAWAEALKAVLENKLADLGQTLENALTGGTSFDTLTTQMERAASLQEEYLTTTNQIYETNKLMRTAQQEIDKTTNSVAKKKLQGFIEETLQLQDLSKLSSYELEIQLAKYDLLLAEIALQEAQDAKSVVRLQRDSEGNFGYVYTADGDKMAEAQQQLEDAQNNLYNIGLEGANDYAQKYQQTMQEMYDTLGEIQSQYLDGAFESEAEYQQAMEEAKEYYYQKLQDYSSLYSVALTTDSRVVADAWSTDFSHMIYDTEKWKDAVETYTNDAIAAFREWQAEVTGPDGVTTIIGSSVSEVGKNVEEVTTKSGDLAEKVTDDVIPALDAEIKSVQGLTGEYANLRDTINEIIEKYSLMISTINGEQQAEWDKGDSTEGGGAAAGEDGTTEDGTSGGDTSGGDGSNGDGTSPDTDPKTETPTLATGSTVQVKTTATHFSRDGGNGTRMKDFVPGSYYDVLEVDDDEVRIGKNKATTGWVYKTDLVGFDTGGYTGDWAGSYGKLAFLHQKEMVLNAKDTENLLMSMELLTQILDAIDLQSASAQIGGILSSPGFMNAGAQTIEQNVHIEASFPGVSDRNELEEAFNNLINRASQYANRK